MTVLRGNAGEVATLVGAEAEVRGVESIAAGLEPAELARQAARHLGLVASVTGPVDHVSDGERMLAVANGHPLLATVTGTGCISSALTGCFLAAKPDEPLEAAAEALAALGVAAEDAADGAAGPGTFHARLYDALVRARSRHARRPGAHRGAVTTLGEVGELGLLAELERRGLVAGNRARRRGRRRPRRHAGRARRRRPLPLRPRSAGASSAARAAAVNVSDLAASGADPLALLVSLASRRRPSSTTCSSSTRA